MMKRDALPFSDKPASSDTVRWPGSLALQATRDASGATRVHARHEGPLRLLKTLYPEGPGIAHAVLVHPPGGLVGGDRLDVQVDVAAGAHLLLTNPAATRFYRSLGLPAVQQVQARVAPGARLEWLPQETLAYDGCKGVNEVRLRLEGEDSSLMASELLALGLPEAGKPFTQGSLLQHLEIEGLWRDRGRIDAQDEALLHGPCGLGGRRVLGTLLFAQGRALDAAALEPLIDASRAMLAEAAAEHTSLIGGVTLLHGRMLLARLLADDVEPAQAVLRRVRALWRKALWDLEPVEPRIWAT